MDKLAINVWTDNLAGYKLIDSGDKKKLEQIGDFFIVRSEPRAWWKPSLPESEWCKAVAIYDREDKGEWKFKQQLPDLVVESSGLKAKIKFTKTSKHIGIFPEQSEQWAQIQEMIGKEKREINVLNLFGYTGMASLAASKAGAKVTHVDGSKVAITWARENQELSGLSNSPIRWILDDVVKYVKREVKRGKKYDAIIMDPPAFGRGPKGQVWKVEKDLPELLDLCQQLLSDDPLFIILTMYAIESSSLSLNNLLQDLTKDFKGEVTAGELALKHQSSEKLLPLSIFSLWQK